MNFVKINYVLNAFTPVIMMDLLFHSDDLTPYSSASRIYHIRLLSKRGAFFQGFVEDLRSIILRHEVCSFHEFLVLK